MSDNENSRSGVASVTYDPPLDAGIRSLVETLVSHGVETFESCEGGVYHAFAEPTVRFHGGHVEGFRALGIALAAGFPVRALNRSWPVEASEPTGPYWEIVLWRPGRTIERALAKGRPMPDTLGPDWLDPEPIV